MATFLEGFSLNFAACQTFWHGRQCFGNPNPYNLSKSTAVHLQFVRQYAPHLYRRTFLASKLRRKGNPAIRLPFVLQYASHLYGSTPPICTAVLLEKYWGLGSPERNQLSKSKGPGEEGVQLKSVPEGYRLGWEGPM